jgi:hypothetical protein
LQYLGAAAAGRARVVEHALRVFVIGVQFDLDEEAVAEVAEAARTEAARTAGGASAPLNCALDKKVLTAALCSGVNTVSMMGSAARRKPNSSTLLLVPQAAGFCAVRNAAADTLFRGAPRRGRASHTPARSVTTMRMTGARRTTLRLRSSPSLTQFTRARSVRLRAPRARASPSRARRRPRTARTSRAWCCACPRGSAARCSSRRLKTRARQCAKWR